MSGPVGTHASVPPTVEANACARLGLGVAPVTTQIIQRDRHAFFLSVLAGVGVATVLLPELADEPGAEEQSSGATDEDLETDARLQE